MIQQWIVTTAIFTILINNLWVVASSLLPKLLVFLGNGIISVHLSFKAIGKWRWIRIGIGLWCTFLHALTVSLWTSRMLLALRTCAAFAPFRIPWTIDAHRTLAGTAAISIRGPGSANGLRSSKAFENCKGSRSQSDTTTKNHPNESFLGIACPVIWNLHLTDESAPQYPKLHGRKATLKYVEERPWEDLVEYQRNPDIPKRHVPNKAHNFAGTTCRIGFPYVSCDLNERQKHLHQPSQHGCARLQF